MTSEMSERKWLGELSESLHSLGWRKAGIKYASAKGLYYKLVDDLVMTLAIELSRHDAAKFTASFYLAPTFCWPLAGGDCPTESYRRIGEMLQHEEYPQLKLPPPISEKDVDAWWFGFSAKTLAGFLVAVEVAEGRFRGQKGLVESVYHSKRYGEHLALVKKVQSAVTAGNLLSPPTKTKMNRDVPIEWYAGATYVLSEHGAIPLPEKVRFVAEDAWCLSQAVAVG